MKLTNRKRTLQPEQVIGTAEIFDYDKTVNMVEKIGISRIGLIRQFC